MTDMEQREESVALPNCYHCNGVAEEGHIVGTVSVYAIRCTACGICIEIECPPYDKAKIEEARLKALAIWSRRAPDAGALRSALEPFAAFAVNQIHPDMHDAEWIGEDDMLIQVGHFRHARKAYEESEARGAGEEALNAASTIAASTIAEFIIANAELVEIKKNKEPGPIQCTPEVWRAAVKVLDATGKTNERGTLQQEDKGNG